MCPTYTHICFHNGIPYISRSHISSYSFFLSPQTNCCESWSFTLCLHFGFDLVWNSIHFDLVLFSGWGSGCEFRFIRTTDFIPFHFTSTSNYLPVYLYCAPHTSICCFINEFIVICWHKERFIILCQPQTFCTFQLFVLCMSLSRSIHSVYTVKLSDCKPDPTHTEFVYSCNIKVYWMPCKKVWCLMGPDVAVAWPV